jgi:class 3 adenylate cyclase
MREVTIRLIDKLGDDTTGLTLRIGLYSGPVTADMLRGEKSLFQLFGDSVNTTSRIESAGEFFFIQVSSRTADLLSDAGTGHWMLPRADLVEAKGKCHMQKFWLQCIRARFTVGSLPTIMN